MTLQAKYLEMKNYLKDLGSLAVAFSGGVDSTLLTKVAYDVLGSKAIAVTALSPTHPQREVKDAFALAKDIGIRHITEPTDELEHAGFIANPLDRCYICKTIIFSKVLEMATAQGIDHVADGSNVDDAGDFRPGMKAAAELGILSPLQKLSFTKEDIRQLSRQLRLPTAEKPAFACLATRFPYGEHITAEGLMRVDRAEQYLLDLGFEQLRVRSHGTLARIELRPEDIRRFFVEDHLTACAQAFKEFGFAYVSLDIAGYRTGSMNEVLSEKEKESRKREL